MEKLEARRNRDILCSCSEEHIWLSLAGLSWKSQQKLKKVAVFDKALVILGQLMEDYGLASWTGYHIKYISDFFFFL